MDYAALAAQFGGTPAVTAPVQQADSSPSWMADLSRKDQAEIKMKMYAEGRKRLSDLQTDIAAGGSTMGDLNQFGELNRQSSTGSLWQNITPDKPIFRNSESMQMAAIQARLAPAQRTEGSGASSDRDVAMFLRGLPSVENDGPTNAAIRQDFERKYQGAISKASAMRDHLEKFGNLSNFDGEWAQRKAKPEVTSQAAPTGVATMRFNPKTNKMEKVN